MKSDRTRDRHLDTNAALDFLEQRLEPAQRRRVEEHLGRPCDACRERVRLLGELLTTMRADRTGELPPEWRARALEVFVPSVKPAPRRGLLGAVAELLFDSKALPLAAAARRSVGEARRLKFRLGEHWLELELESEGLGTMSVRGLLSAPDASLWTIQVEAGPEHRRVRPDAAGGFVVNGLPEAPITLLLGNDDERYRLPALEP